MTAAFWVIYSLATVWLITLAWYDCRIRRLPNRLTVPAMILFPLLHGLTDGAGGVMYSLLGGLIGGLFLLIPYFLRGAGAGDVKMLAAVGCLTGYPRVLYALIIMSFAGLILGLAMLIAKKADGGRLKHWFHICFDWKYDRKAGAAALAPANEKKVYIPYGVAIAAGGWGSFVWTLCLEH